MVWQLVGLRCAVLCRRAGLRSRNELRAVRWLSDAVARHQAVAARRGPAFVISRYLTSYGRVFAFSATAKPLVLALFGLAFSLVCRCLVIIFFAKVLHGCAVQALTLSATEDTVSQSKSVRRSTLGDHAPVPAAGGCLHTHPQRTAISGRAAPRTARATPPPRAAGSDAGGLARTLRY